MQIETGLAVVILAVLIFYLRLIVLQRERARRLKTSLASTKGKGKDRSPVEKPRYGLLSANPGNRIIGIIGVAAILVGMLSYAGIVPLPALQAYWWVPTAAGIVAFSWLFQL